MNKLKCIVVDDEPLAIDVIAGYIEQVPFLELAGTFNNPVDALMAINKTTIDLVFLDIQMPQLTGIQFMNLLNNRAQIIIVSAYNEYAIEGYEHDVLDYLLKPVPFERFYKAVQKAFGNRQVLVQTETGEKKLEYPDYIFIKVDAKFVKVNYDDIL